MPGLYIGLMSGTSLDGVDAVLADLSEPVPRLVAHAHHAFAPALHVEVASLNRQGNDELRRAALAANELSRVYAAAVGAILKIAAVPVNGVEAVGCHGQTVRHQPADGYSIQLINGALLAELTGITVVCDFRGRDIAAGGQGAPLVPAFHQAVFARNDEHRAIVNIGGISNVTNLPIAGVVTGFDCGPGNLLLDAWVQRHLNQPFDRDGHWAKSGRTIPDLLGRLKADEYFRRAPPKSAGRETFNLEWLEKYLAGSEAAVDVQATLLALTAHGIADAIKHFCAAATAVYGCGGGARNIELIKVLTVLLAPRRVRLTDELGIDAEQVEALAFAWLAQQTLTSKAGNLPAVTGARGPRILGAIYCA